MAGQLPRPLRRLLAAEWAERAEWAARAWPSSARLSALLPLQMRCVQGVRRKGAEGLEALCQLCLRMQARPEPPEAIQRAKERGSEEVSLPRWRRPRGRRVERKGPFPSGIAFSAHLHARATSLTCCYFDGQGERRDMCLMLGQLVLWVQAAAQI